MPPPQQKPTDADLAVDVGRVFRNATAADGVASSSRFSSPIMSRALSSSPGVPPSGDRISGASATKPSSATRRATSLICGLRPRFSWMTMTVPACRHPSAARDSRTGPARRRGPTRSRRRSARPTRRPSRPWRSRSAGRKAGPSRRPSRRHAASRSRKSRPVDAAMGEAVIEPDDFAVHGRSLVTS